MVDHFLSTEKRKDPGVPNAAPFKEQVLKEAEERRRRLEQEKERQKEKRKKERQAILEKKRNLSSLVKDAQKRTDEFNKKVTSAELFPHNAHHIILFTLVCAPNKVLLVLKKTAVE